jgi:hypothetical protein
MKKVNSTCGRLISSDKNTVCFFFLFISYFFLLTFLIYMYVNFLDNSLGNLLKIVLSSARSTTSGTVDLKRLKR